MSSSGNNNLGADERRISSSLTQKRKEYMEQIGVNELIEELIQRAQEEQSSQTSLVIDEHRKRKGRKGGLEFKVQKVKKRFWGEQRVGTEYWQPEASLSQEKLTSYWERLNYNANKAEGYKRDIKPLDLEVFAKEGNACRKKPKDCKSPSNIFQYEAVPMKYTSHVNLSNASVKE